MSLISLTVSQLASEKPSVSSVISSKEYVTANDIAESLRISNDKARYLIKKLCSNGTLIEDGKASVVTPNYVLRVKRFKVLRTGGLHGA